MTRAGRSTSIQATERLRKLEAEHQEVADKTRSLQTAILSFDEGKGGENNRRYTATCNGLIIRNVEAIHKGRRAEAAEEDIRRKAEIESLGNPDEAVLIMDEDGTVHYDSGRRTIENHEGRARYLAARKKTHLVAKTDSPCDDAEDHIPRVPDYAIWVKEERLKEERERLNQKVVTAQSFGNDPDGGRQNEAVDDGRNEAVGDLRNEAVDDERNEAVDDQRNEAVDDVRNEAVDDERNEAVDDWRNEAVGARRNADGGRMKQVTGRASDAIGAREVRTQRTRMGGAGVKRGSGREQKRKNKNWRSENEKLSYYIAELADGRKQLLSSIAALEEPDGVNR